MKIKRLPFFGLFFMVWLACLPGARAQDATKRMQVFHEQMRANVTQIAASAERDRWQTNTDMWQIVISHPDGLSNVELELLRTDLHSMETNESAITEPNEHDRWHANVLMWTVMIGHMANLNYVRYLDQLKSFFDRMETNVADISEPSEKERWQANIGIWQLMLDRLSASADTNEEKRAK
jgi:hypothetical protein